MSNQPVNAETRIGHIQLKVADLSRAIDFFHVVLGFQVMQRPGNSAAFSRLAGITTTSLYILRNAKAGHSLVREPQGHTT